MLLLLSAKIHPFRGHLHSLHSSTGDQLLPFSFYHQLGPNLHRPRRHETLLKEIISHGKPDSLCQRGGSRLDDHDPQLYSVKLARFGHTGTLFHLALQQGLAKSYIFVLLSQDHRSARTILGLEGSR